MTEPENTAQPVPVADEDDADIGPQLPKAKKRKTLKFEEQYLGSLPLSEMYEKSYMHRDTVTNVAVAEAAGFFITGSTDGVVKFWKKDGKNVEFAKQFKSHLQPITDMSVSADGALCATISSDKTVKVFDVSTFDMIAIIRLAYSPGTVEFVFQQGGGSHKVAVSDVDSPAIHLYDVRSGQNEPIATASVHSSPVSVMRYNHVYDIVISADNKGMIEYWSPKIAALSKDERHFHSKMDTDLFTLMRAKATAWSISVAADGSKFAMYSSDNKVRVFKFLEGKLSRAYDESVQAAQDLQAGGPDSCKVDSIDFGRRLTIEKQLNADITAPKPNLTFDSSGNFLIYPTLLGIKVVNLVTNRLVKVIGKVENTERFLRVALYQGQESRKLTKIPVDVDSAAASRAHATGDPTLVCCAYQKDRLYLFTQREPDDEEESGKSRDVFNERPTDAVGPAGVAQVDMGSLLDLPRGAVLHTNYGDIHLKLYPDECPRTVENFATHSKNGYYDGLIFHRVIKGFMIQGGDPLGDGTGGESCWGGEFEDEINKALRHDRVGTLAMANAGPNTNGSQFYITCAATPWLDGKHTVWGRVSKGLDVVKAIENTKTNPKNDKPVDDVKIMSITLSHNIE